MNIKNLRLTILLLLPNLASANYEITYGFGFEMKLGSKRNFEFFTFQKHKEIGLVDAFESRQYINGDNAIHRKFSCIPSEEDPECKKAARSAMIIYAIALPASLYLYKLAYDEIE